VGSGIIGMNSQSRAALSDYTFERRHGLLRVSFFLQRDGEAKMDAHVLWPNSTQIAEHADGLVIAIYIFQCVAERVRDLTAE
jgi:hypothetical protein